MSAAVALGAVAFALSASPATAAPTSDSSTYALTSTTAVGKTTRDLAVDDTTGRVYVAGSPTESGGTVTWLDTATRAAVSSAYDTTSADPENLALSPDGSKLYVLGYTSGDLSVIDTATGSTLKTITGLPTYAGGLVQDTDTGKLYVLDTGLTPVDPATGVFGTEVPISKQAYPLLKDAVYDATNRMIWVAEGRSSVITGYSTVTGKWIDSLAIPVGKFAVDGTATGGRPALLAIDEDLGQLYAVVAPTISDKWKNNKVITVDTTTTKHLGAPIEVGDTARSITVNPATHEVYVLNGFSNTLSVISPASWSVSNTVDFTALGVTTGTGTAAANVWAMGVNARGSEIYVTHPYGTARMSVIERSGATPAVTPQAVAPGQDTEMVPTEPVNSPWSGPAAASPAAAPAGAVDVGQPTLRWAFNEYAKAWTRDPLGSTTLTNDQFTFSKGTGWVDPKTGAASIAWSDGFRFRHYAELAPDVISTYGNPVLTINAAGTGTLTFDVSWSVAADTKSDGFKRIPVATFTDAAVSLDNGSLTISGTPDYTGRNYTDVNGTSHPNSFPAEFINWFDPGMRAWWYTTGASMDAKKIPLPLTASGSVDLP
ncbi:HtaA domain-containing protein, partial [Curtobacterium sp. ME12]|uniref:HtaA domain-containing protein n=1 Tax=Curtobacterium sp. ME12 TaxID=2744253 RepID=UPI0015F54352